MNTLPFFNIYSEALKQMLGVKDFRSVKKKLEEIGVPVHGVGKNQVIYTHEVFEALDKEENSSSYTGKSDISRI